MPPREKQSRFDPNEMLFLLVLVPLRALLMFLQVGVSAKVDQVVFKRERDLCLKWEVPIK